MQCLLDDGVLKKKIFRVYLCHNFDDWLSGNVKVNPAEIRKTCSIAFLLLSVSRLTKSKRILAAFEVVKILRNKGHNCGLVIIGVGEMEFELHRWIADSKMGNFVRLEGFKANVLDYLQAADMRWPTVIRILKMA